MKVIFGEETLLDTFSSNFPLVLSCEPWTVEKAATTIKSQVKLEMIFSFQVPSPVAISLDYECKYAKIICLLTQAQIDSAGQNNEDITLTATSADEKVE